MAGLVVRPGRIVREQRLSRSSVALMAAPDTAERRFYLAHFDGRSIVIGYEADAPVPAVEHAVDQLVHGGARVVVVRGHAGGGELDADEDSLGDRWSVLRRTGRVDLTVGADPFVAAVAVAIRLRPFKLVLLTDDAPAGVDVPPFVTLTAAQATPDVGPFGRWAATALAGGVGSVNVCRPRDIVQELLTYRGAGVLYTSEAYCTVERLRLDDYESANRLIEQGVAEGYLLPRPPGRIARLLLDGYGARFGDDHLAGFAALLTRPYAEQAMGEVSAVTTISRFAGGGVGGMLVRGMLADAGEAGLSAVFACTTSVEAAGFFSSLGFRPIDPDSLPPAKWANYDSARRARITALIHEF